METLGNSNKSTEGAFDPVAIEKLILDENIDDRTVAKVLKEFIAISSSTPKEINDLVDLFIKKRPGAVDEIIKKK